MNKVSIIVRTSTRYIFLNRAIKDIINQTYKDWKIIIVNDNGDLEKIKRIIKENNLKEDKYRLINNEGQAGLHKAINLGAKAVDTEYVVVHDDDDTWHKDFLSETVGFLEENKEDII